MISKTRVMPCLLIKNSALVKTIQFENPNYVGDPSNAIRIFNEKEVDELIFLDIGATEQGCGPNLDMIERIASECFMPVVFGGGVRDIVTMRSIFKRGIEKISLNTYAWENPQFLREAADEFGSQAVVVSIDAYKRLDGSYEVFTRGGKFPTGTDPRKWAETVVKHGAGEILITSIDRDGTMKGYDTDLIHAITSSVDIPVIACGGAGKASHFRDAVVDGGASAVAAGSMFVYYGRKRAVLISFPSKFELDKFKEK